MVPPIECPISVTGAPTTESTKLATTSTAQSPDGGVLGIGE